MKITLFSWGYWGWGNRTRELVRLATESEAREGFGPPFFVDVRFRRSVRAVGFRDRAFESLVGPDGYRWMKSLGNARIGTGEGGIEILRPEAAVELLALARALHEKRRRVIFFCSCPSPEATHTCHRAQVRRLVRGAAKAAQTPVSVVEWMAPPCVPHRRHRHRVRHARRATDATSTLFPPPTADAAEKRDEKYSRVPMIRPCNR